MVQVTDVYTTKSGVVVEYLTSGITISTLVKDTDKLTPQEIIKKGFDEISTLVRIECERQRIPFDEELPTVEDEVISIELLGIHDINFTEGQSPIEVSPRCVGTTKFGKKLNLTPMATFEPELPIVVEPTESYGQSVTVRYNEFSDTKCFWVNYTTLQEIADREAERLAAEQAEAERLANLPPSIEEEVAELKTLVADLASIVLEV